MKLQEMLARKSSEICELVLKSSKIDCILKSKKANARERRDSGMFEEQKLGEEALKGMCEELLAKCNKEKEVKDKLSEEVREMRKSINRQNILLNSLMRDIEQKLKHSKCI
eukprot:TRINITY_DN3565_c0_g2_i1.p2 TRINITY_DN3565_c0_g2~~TRINITY_DN3565_c0_g2_i1.p2  ORF type:complete len:111 (-),score=31.10 TRINITY_DN3565_c0_g2_i1:114-446(-)